MAPPLTWRNVDTPDFRGSLAGLNVAANSLDRAFSGLSDGLGKFQTYRQEQADNAALRNAQRFSDPAEYQAALARGDVMAGLDPTLVTPRTLQALDNRSSVLLDQATARERLSFDQRANPLRLTGMEQNNTRSQQDIDFNREANPLRLTQMALGNEGQTIQNQRSRIGVDSDTLSLERGRFTFGNERRNDADTQTALGFIGRFGDEALLVEDAYNLRATPEYRALSPGARSLVDAEIGRRWAGAFSPPATAATAPTTGTPASGAIATAANRGARTAAPGSSAPGTAGTRAGSPFDVAYGFTATPAPVSTMNIGDVVDFQRTQLLPRVGASPVGAFQINHATLSDFAPRVLGSDWRNQPLSPENQDRIAKAIFEERRNGNLSQTWAALPDRGVGGYANMSWEEIRPLIAQREVGATPESLTALRTQVASAGARTNQAVGQIGERLTQERADGITARYAAAGQDNSTISEVAAKLKQNPVYQNLPIERLINDLQDVMTAPGPDGRSNTGINAARAGLLLENNPQGAGFIRRNLPTILGGYSVVPNTEAVRRDAALMQQGTTFDATEQAQTMEAQAAALESARQAHTTAAANLAEVTRRGMTNLIPRYRAQLGLAQASLEAALGRQQKDATLQPRRSAPANAAATAVAQPGETTLPPAALDTGTPAPTPTATRTGTPAAAALASAAAPAVPPAAEQIGQQIDEARSALSALQREAPRPPSLRQRQADPEGYARWREQDARRQEQRAALQAQIDRLLGNYESVIEGSSPRR
jgi:hypothetical protein